MRKGAAEDNETQSYINQHEKEGKNRKTIDMLLERFSFKALLT